MSDPLPVARTGEETGADVHVIAMLRWPAEVQRRRQLAAEGRPRLLLVDPGVDIPVLIDELEDWVRCPAHPDDLLGRRDALRRRVVQRTMVPVIDEGLLRFDGRWVNIPERQLAVVTLLVQRFGRVVPAHEVAATYCHGPASSQSSTVKTALVRIRARVAKVGLRLHVLRGRGVLLDVWRDDSSRGGDTGSVVSPSDPHQSPDMRR